MTFPRSSGSRRVESAVEPTRSQNITVICRRSAEAAARPTGDGGAVGGAASGRATASPSLAPHCAQKRESARLTWPQAPQVKACGVPHCGQKRLSLAISLPQLGQALVLAISDYIAGGRDAGDRHSAVTRLRDIYYIYPAAGFDPAPFGHEEPVTPDERAPFIRGRFFVPIKYCPKRLSTNEGPGFPGLHIFQLDRV